MKNKTIFDFKQRLREEELPALKSDIKTLQQLADYIERNVNNISEQTVSQFEKDVDRITSRLMIVDI